MSSPPSPRRLEMTRGARYAVVFLFALTVALAAANLLWTSRQVAAAIARVQAQCRFNADLGTAPVATNPKTGKPSLLSVTIVSDARLAYRQLGCGRPAPPAPSFTRWAVYYRLPIN